jgi:signal transduction histidine kinase
MPARRRIADFIGVPLFILAFLMGRLPALAAAVPPVLTKVRRILELTPEQARLQFPVAVTGVVTYVYFPKDGPWMLFVQDDTAGIFVAGHAQPLKVGDLVSVTGFTDPGDFAPRVRNTSVRVLGTAPLPDAEAKSYENLMTGEQDCQWVKIRGIIRSAHFEQGHKNQLVLDLACGTGRLTAKILTETQDVSRLPDTAVSVRGVCTTLFNRKRQLLGVEIYTQALTNLIVEEPAPLLPFEIAESPIDNLMQFSRGVRLGHRVKVSGVVTFQRTNQCMYLRGQAGALFVQMRDTAGVRVGDTVEALGFPAPGDFSAVLQDAVCRRTGGGQSPQARAIDVGPALSGTYDADLIEIEAKVLKAVRTADQEILTVQASNVVFSAIIDNVDLGREPFQKGSRLKLIGICTLPPGSQLASPKSFRLLLRSAADAVVLEDPPWWTLPRLAGAGAMAVLLALIASVWCVVVSRKNSLLREHRRVQQEILEISGREQRRIGQDLHDGVCQELGAIACLVKMLEEELNDAGSKHAPSAREISKYLGEAISQTRSVAKGLFPVKLEENGLESALEELAASTTRRSRVRCEYHCARPASLRDNTAALNLYCIAHEAVANAVKHAQPSRIRIDLSHLNGKLTLTVRNDGRWFPDAQREHAGMGLHIMNYRAQTIGATLAIESDADKGCAVVCSLPTNGHPAPRNHHT